MDVLIFDHPGTRDDPGSFASRVGPVLAQHPVSTSVLATWLEDTIAGRQSQPTSWILIQQEGSVLAAGMHTAGSNIMVSPLPEASRDAAASVLANTLLARGEPMPGVTARAADAQAFAQAWQALGGDPGRISLNEWLYVIGAPPVAPPVDGAGRSSRPDDVPVLVQYLTEFYAEAHPWTTDHSVSDQAVRRLERGDTQVWERDGEIVSLAGLNGPVEGLARIGPVYTPPRLRGSGFGGAVTAFATRLGFERGAESVMLYADQDNPTSNGVYARLGYEIVDSHVMLSFEPRRA